MVSNLLSCFYKLLSFLACVAMVATFVVVGLGILARQMGWDIQGLDGYAGYAIASALFLALPGTFKRGEHIRVTVVLERLGTGKLRKAFELWCLLVGLGLSSFLAFYAGRLAWFSYLTHDVSPSMDATPMWIPQMAAVFGCLGLALAFAEALVRFLMGREFFDAPGAEAARME